jgi:hypothetical protein
MTGKFRITSSVSFILCHVSKTLYVSLNTEPAWQYEIKTSVYAYPFLLLTYGSTYKVRMTRVFRHPGATIINSGIVLQQIFILFHLNI